jgi:hypothetical protein
MPEAPGKITKLLIDMRNGSPEAEESLFAIVYRELRKVAARRLRRPVARAPNGVGACVIRQKWFRLPALEVAPAQSVLTGFIKHKLAVAGK